MSTSLAGSAPKVNLPSTKDMRFAIVTAKWNSHITYALRDGALEVLRGAGVDDEDIATFEVPGAVELTFAASQLIETSQFDAVIVLGCVIRGGTPHFDYVCQIAAQGIANLNSEGKTPVIFGVLTVDNLNQARERAGGILGNKGSEAGAAAITMANLHSSFWF